jgi:Major Facilitator Superfamily
MGGIVLGILVWQEGGEAVGALLVIGAIAMAALFFWLSRRKRQGKPTLDPDLFKSKHFKLGISQQLLQQIALGGTMIALPIYLQMVLEYNAMLAGLSIAPLSLSMFGMALLAGRRAGKRRPPQQHHPVGIRAAHGGDGGADPDRAAGGLRLVSPGPTGDRGIRVGVVGVPAQQLHAGPDLGGAGQRGRRRELGGRIVRAVVRAGVRRRHHAFDPLHHLHQHGGSEHRA